jgi:hypothetical protein
MPEPDNLRAPDIDPATIDAVWDGSSDFPRPTYWALDESPYTRDADDIDGWLYSTKLGFKVS